MSQIKRHLRKSVKIDVCLTQCIGNQTPWVVEEEVLGSLYQVDEQTFILAYDSWMDEQKQTTTLKLANQTLSLVRIGEVHTRQTFAEQQWYASQYFFDGGSVVCRNHTKKLDISLHEDGGFVDLLYELWSGDSHLGYFNLELFIQ